MAHSKGRDPGQGRKKLLSLIQSRDYELLKNMDYTARKQIKQKVQTVEKS
jgi:hypothetical protein